jgi:hypothetical protein
VTVLADAVRVGDLGEREGLRDRERETPGLDQLADLGEGMDRAAGLSAAEPHPVLPGSAKSATVTTRPVPPESSMGSASNPAPGDVDAVESEHPNPPGEALAQGGLDHDRGSGAAIFAVADPRSPERPEN